MLATLFPILRTSAMTMFFFNSEAIFQMPNASFLGVRSSRQNCDQFPGKKYQQLKDMEYGCEIVAATPGRLLDFMVQQLDGEMDVCW